MSQVSDYNIANASGASVRSDLNAVFDAIKTLNSGGPDPTNTASFMPYVDTADNNNLKIRNSSNNGFTTIGPVDTANLGLLPVAGGTMTGTLALPNQSAGTPSINFGDASTGLFRRGSNQIGFTFSGTEKIFTDQNGVTLMDRTDVRFSESSGNGVNYVALQAPASVANDLTFTLPGLDGSSGQVLKTDGSGNLSFTTISTFSGAASALTGNTLASGVTASSLTSVGTLGVLTVSGNINANGTINANGNILGDGATSITNISNVRSDNVRVTSHLEGGAVGKTPVVTDSAGTNIGYFTKAWVNFNGNGTVSIRGSFNVSSITDHTTGQYSVNFTNQLRDGNGTLSDNICPTEASSCSVYPVGGQLSHTRGAIHSFGKTACRFHYHPESTSTHLTDQAFVCITVTA